MGLDDVDKESFNKAISSFRVKREQIEARYREVRNENQQRYQAEHEAQAKRDQEELIASERPINLVLWTNPTPEQKIILNALNTIKFTIRGNRVTYANGRWFMSVDGLESLRNSLDMSLSSCSDVGAYAGEKVISRACVQGLAGTSSNGVRRQKIPPSQIGRGVQQQSMEALLTTRLSTKFSSVIGLVWRVSMLLAGTD